MIQLCAIHEFKLYQLLLSVLSTLVIRILAKIHISATLILSSSKINSATGYINNSSSKISTTSSITIIF